MKSGQVLSNGFKMSGGGGFGFGTGNKDNLFGQSQPIFGSNPSTTGNVFVPSVNLKDSSSTGSIFGSSSTQSVFGSSSSLHSTASGENLFAQITSPTPAASAFTSTNTGFGEAKLFGAKESKSLSPAALFSKSPPVFGAKGSASAPNITTKPTSQTLFGKPVVSSSVFGGRQTNLDRDKPVKGEGDEDSQDKGAKPKHQNLFGKYPDLQQVKHPSEIRKKSLFGKSVKGETDTDRTTRKPFIKRGEKTGSAAQSIFRKAMSGATGKGVDDRTQEPTTERPAKVRKPSEEVSGESRSARRLSRSTSEEIANKVALVCKDVPSSVNNVIQLKKHFSRYGTVTKVFPSPAKRSATVHFKTHEDAANAKRKGRVLLPGQPPLQLFWSSHTPGSSGTPLKPGTSRKGSQSRAPTVSISRDVEDELASMSQADTGASYHSVQRPIDTGASQETSPHKRPMRRHRSLSPPPARVVSPSPMTTQSETAIQPTTTSVTKASLESLLTPAKNTLDKYLILENRDRIIKQGRKKQSDLKTAKAVEGTCPDMCYEKERYDRDAKRRLTVFEIVPGTENIPGQNPQVDHCRAVKEYSRSSADQEEPLPHEMRPSHVLEMTMTYLLREIADTGREGNWLDWYDFLWNRTRGIRKDITQQMLCNKAAVGLIEKCARFHIYCAERLSEEDFHTFDQKINTENLTKSLQSLKELYSDLAIKHQLYCDSEAEFRAYLVLLNLNEGDTLREVQQLRPEVRASPELNFAIQVYSALNSNNYVRFFKLVKKATFLMGCILHRYFVQVRSRALKTMLRAFPIGGRPVQYPLIEMVRVLAFEDTEEAGEFCTHYGLTAMAGEVLLDRTSYIEPEVGVSMRRGINLIESKLHVSVGQVINGGELPPLNLPVPQNSFDERGKYVGEMPHVEVKELDRKPVLAEGSSSVNQYSEQTAREPPAKPKLTVPNEIIKDIARQLFFDVTDEFSKSVAQDIYDLGHYHLKRNTAQLWEETLQDVIFNMARDVSAEVVENERIQKEKVVAMRERIAQRERAARAEMEVLLEEVVTEDISQMAKNQMLEVESRLKHEQESRCTETLSDDLMLEVMSEMIQDTAEGVYHHDVVHRLRQLHEIEQSIQLYCTSKMWHRWKRAFVSRRRLKSAMITFPSAPCTENIIDQVNSLIPDRKEKGMDKVGFYMNSKAKLYVKGPQAAEEEQKWLDDRVTLHHIVDSLRYILAWSPLNIGEIIGRQLVQTCQKHGKHKVKTGDHVFWKLLVSLPGREGSDENTQILCDWLEAKFTKGVVPDLEEACSKVKTVALYTSPVKSSKHSPVVQLGTCVKIITGTLQDKEIELLEEENSLMGSSAILLALPPTHDDQDEYWLEAQLRLVRILQAKPVYPSLPLVILFPESSNNFPPTAKIYEMLGLLKLMEEDLISSVHILSMKFSSSSGLDIVSHNSTNQLEEALRWFSEHFLPPPDLQTNSLLSLVEEILSMEFFTPVLHNLHQRKKQGYLHQSPEILITLYNSVIQHLADVITSPALTIHSWPVTEFAHSRKDLPRPYWNSVDHMTYLGHILHSLVLPTMHYGVMESDSWQQASTDVWRFVDRVSHGMSAGHQRTQLHSIVRSLLKKCEADFEDTCFLVEGDTQCEPTYVNMPWTDIIMAAVNYKLLSSNFNDPNQSDELLMVHFEENELNFIPPLEWKIAQTERETEGGVLLKSTVQIAAVRKRHLTSQEDSLSTKKTCVDVVDDSPTFDTEPLSETVVLATDTSNSLKDVLANEKKNSLMFEEYLKKALNSEETDSLGFTSLRSRGSLNASMEVNLSTVSTPCIRLTPFRRTPSPSLTFTVDDDRLSPVSLQQGLDTLKQEAATNRHADELFEMRLRNILQS